MMQQAEIEKYSIEQLIELKNQSNEEIEKLDISIINAKLKIEKLENLKSFVNKLIFFKNGNEGKLQEERKGIKESKTNT